MDKTPLTPQQKHILKLIAQGKQSDGWTVVSATLYKFLCHCLPNELAIFEPIGKAGRAKLTTTGQNLIDAMAWL